VLDAIPGSESGRNQINDIVLLPGGKFLACGTTADDFASNGRFVLARYNANGTIDTSYGDGGVATIPFGNLTRVVLDADGNAIAIGGAERDLAVARVTAEGQFDQTFGRVVISGFGQPSEDPFTGAQAAFVQPDGKLVLAGWRGGLDEKTFLTRLHMSDDGLPSPVALAASGVLTINGTAAGERLQVIEDDGFVFAKSRGFGRAYEAHNVSRIEMFAHEGNDYVLGNDVANIPILAFGGLGGDKMTGSQANDTLEGSGGNDFIDAYDGDDFLLGGNGDDALRGMAGMDKLVGGRGNDTEADINLPGFVHDDESFLTFTDPVGADDTIFIRENGSGDLVVTSNGVTQTIPRASVKEIVLRGEAGNDRLELDPGVSIRVTIYAGAGNDTLIGGAEFDELYGHDGDDVLIANANGSYLFGGNGNDSITGGVGWVDFADGGDGNDTINGGAGPDRLSGAAGNDRVEGGEGDDVVEGGAGHDFVDGGPGADKLFGWAGNDTLFADDMSPDTLDGGVGDTDTAVIDRFDVVGECEIVR
jgi:uncharacterized delta-60 repeat protein